jgi:hypothetical protein
LQLQLMLPRCNRSIDRRRCPIPLAPLPLPLLLLLLPQCHCNCNCRRRCLIAIAPLPLPLQLPWAAIKRREAPLQARPVTRHPPRDPNWLLILRDVFQSLQFCCSGRCGTVQSLC